MTDVQALVQTTLDSALSPTGVRSYWLRKAGTVGEDPDEYIVYTIAGDAVGAYADNRPLTRDANITVRYYFRDALLDSAAGRADIKVRTGQIAAALEGAGFMLPGGPFDAGDIDDIGFGTRIFEAYYSRVV